MPSATLDELRAGLDKLMHRYNMTRRYSKFGYKTSIAYQQQFNKVEAQAA